MEVIQSNTNLHTMLQMYKRVASAPEREVRGSKSRNVHNLCMVFDAGQSMLTSFKARNFNLTYAKKEWLWYLGADKMDDSIEKHATMWQKLKQPDGSYFSNYGQYIFGRTRGSGLTQFEHVVHTLKTDKYSRQASIVLLDKDHLFEGNKDVVCTYAINFTISADQLHMTVMMRSNDVIFGFTNDAFCFAELYEFVYKLLKRKYEDLQRGSYTHMVNSMHVYERHYDMIKALCADMTLGGYDRIMRPQPTAEEVVQIVQSQGKEGRGEYYSWLTAD